MSSAISAKRPECFRHRPSLCRNWGPEFTIDNCELTTFPENALIGAENVTKVITISNNPNFTSEDSSIFKILSKFINAEKIKLANNGKVTEIPTNAFALSIEQEVKNVRFENDPVLIIENNTNYRLISRIINDEDYDFNHNNTIIDTNKPRSPMSSKLKFLIFDTSFTKINSYAFSTLDNLEKITLNDNRFDTIAENAFTFQHASNKSLILEFTQTNEARYDFGFNEKSLANTNRPTKLILINLYRHYRPESQRYLDERIYLPFLLSNPHNTVNTCFHYETIFESFYNCSDLRHNWFTNNNDLVHRVKHCNIDFEYVSCS